MPKRYLAQTAGKEGKAPSGNWRRAVRPRIDFYERPKRKGHVNILSKLWTFTVQTDSVMSGEGLTTACRYWLTHAKRAPKQRQG
jgi:hypothetical protein